MYRLGRILSLAALYCTNEVLAQVEVKDSLFTIPQSCFSTREMIETTQASADVADFTNLEELFTDLFEMEMSVSKLTVCRTNSLGITGMQLELSTPPTEEDGSGAKTLALAPIGDMTTQCKELDIERGTDIVSMEMRYKS